MTRVIDWYFRLLRFFMVGCLVVMVVLVFGNVVLRYAFNSGITVSEELSRWLFVWLFVGAIVASGWIRWCRDCLCGARKPALS